MLSMAVQVVNTTPYHGYQVLFSPYSPAKIAFTGAQNYGIAGKQETVAEMSHLPRPFIMLEAWLKMP